MTNYKLKNNCNFFVLTVLFSLQVLDNALREDQVNVLSNIKTFFLLLVMLFFSIQLLNRKIKYLKSKYELKNIIAFFLSLLLLSLFWMIKNNTFNYAPFIIGAQRIITPILMAFLILNLFSRKDIYDEFLFFLIFTFLAFLCVKAYQGRLNFDGILNISLTDSTSSELESNFFSPVSISLFIFFRYFDKKKWPIYLSFLFVLLTYKRLMIFYAIFMMIFADWIKNKHVKASIKYIIEIIFFLFTVFYVNLNAGIIDSNFINKYFGISLNDFTMGRTIFFQRIYNYSLPRSGLFSISQMPFQNPEMDLPVMYLEMGYLSCILTILFILRLAKKSLYLFLTCLFVLLEMLTSHWLDITFFWIVFYITVSLINQDGDELYV